MINGNGTWGNIRGQFVTKIKFEKRRRKEKAPKAGKQEKRSKHDKVVKDGIKKEERK